MKTSRLVVLLGCLALSSAARAGWYSGVNQLRQHGHSGPGDGGTLTELRLSSITVSTQINAEQGFKLWNGSTVTIGSNVGWAADLARISSETWTAQTAVSPCPTGAPKCITANLVNAGISTFTFTSYTGKVKVSFEGTLNTSNSGSAHRSTYLIDGAYPDGLSATRTLAGGVGIDGGQAFHKWDETVRVSTGAAHRFTLAVGSDGGVTVNFCYQTASVIAKCRFQVEDVP